MKLLPYEKTEETINVPKDVLVKALTEHIQLAPNYWLISDQKEKPFHGNREYDEWMVFLKTSYRNSFKPHIRMKIKSLGDSSHIIFEFRIAQRVKVFLLIWTILILLFSQPWNQTDLLNQDVVDILTPLGMIGFALLITHLGFYMELDRSMEQMKRIVKKIKTTANNG
jgi:hypothetical protein